MARTKTNTVNVKVDDKGTKVTVSVECAPASELSREHLEMLYNSQWKQYIYSTVSQTIKSMYPEIATNRQYLLDMKEGMGLSDEQIAKFIKYKADNGSPLALDLPNHFMLGADLMVTFDTVTETPESDELPDLPEENLETEETEAK